MIAGSLEVQLFANVAQLVEGMQRAERSVKDTMDRIGRYASAATSALGAIGLGVGLAGLIAWQKKALETADAASKMAQRAGISVEELTRLQHAARLSGVSNEELGKALIKLNKNAVDASLGVATAKEAFARMGINVKDASGHVKNANTLLYEMADRTAKSGDGALKTASAVDVLGKSGANLIPMMNGGSAALRQMAADADALGVVISTETAQAAEQFNDNLERLKVSGEGLGLTLAAKTLPQLTKISDAMAQAARESGVFAALWAGLGGLGAWAFTDQLDTVPEKIRAIEIEINNLQRHLDYKEGRGRGRLHDWLFGTKDELSEKIAKHRAEIAALQADVAADEKRRRDADEKRRQQQEAEAKAAQARAEAAAGAQKREAAAKAATDYAAGLERETAALELNTIQKKMVEAAAKAAQAPTEAARLAVMKAAQAWAIEAQAIEERDKAAKANNEAIEGQLKLEDEAYKKEEAGIRSVRQKIEALEDQTAALTLSKEALREYNIQRAMESSGLDKASESYRIMERRLREAQTGYDGLKESIESQAGVWKSIEQTAHDTFVSIFDSGKSAFQRLRDTLKNTLLDLLYQMTLKKWIINITSSVSGPSVANRAFGAATGGGGVGGGFNPISFLGSNSIGMGFQGIGDSLFAAGLPTGDLMTAGMVPNWQFGVAGIAGGIAGQAIFGGNGGIGGSIGSTIGFAIGGPVGAVIGTLIGGAIGGAVGKPGNEWGGVYAEPGASSDPDLLNRITQTHGKSSVYKGASGLTLGASWKRTDSEMTKSTLTALSGVDALLYGLTGADMSGKFQGNFYGYDKKRGGYIAGSADKVVGSMDEVIAQFTRDWLDAADKLTPAQKQIIDGFEGTSEALLATVVASFKADSQLKAMGKTLSKTMADAAGGVDKLSAQLADYFNITRTDSEKLALVGADMEKAFGAAGTNIPASIAEYRKLTDAIDTTTEAGAKQYAALVALAPALKQYLDALGAQREALKAWAYGEVDAALAAVEAAVNAQKAEIGKALEAVETAAEKQRAAVEEQSAAAIEAATGSRDAIRAVYQELTQAADATRAALTRAEAQRLLTGALTWARSGGSLANYPGLSDALKVVAQPSQAGFATLVDWKRDQARTANTVEDLRRAAGAQVSVADLTLKAVQDGAAAQIAAIDASIAAARADAAAQIAGLDKQYEVAVQQVNELKGIKTGVDSVETALANLASAIAGANLASRPDAGTTPAVNGPRTVNPAGVVQGRDPLRDATIVRTAEAGDVTGAISLGLSFGYSPSQLEAAWNAAHPESPTTSKAVVQWARDHGITGYAAGGMPRGDFIAGENGPEFVSMSGRPRVYSNADSLGMAEELAALRQEVARLTGYVASTARDTRRHADLFENVTEGGKNMHTVTP